jgi:hypothetical protein
MPISTVAISLCIELVSRLGPLVGDWVSSRKGKKFTVEQRLESAEGILATIGTGLAELSASLAAIQQALEFAEAERRQLKTRIKLLTLGLGLSSAMAVAVLVLVIVHR